MSFDMKMAAGILVPAAVSFAVARILARMATGEVARRFAAAVSAAAGFLAGYSLLRAEHWNPQVYWHALPWMGVLAAAVGIACAAALRLPGVGRTWVPVAFRAALAGTVAWWLAPSRPDSIVSAPLFAVLVGGGVFALMEGLARLAARKTGPRLAFFLALAAAGAAMFVSAEASLTFGVLTALLCTSLAGIWLASLGVSAAPPEDGLAPVYATLASGLMLAGSKSSLLPLAVVALIPLAPLALWLVALGPLKGLTGKAGLAARVAIVLVPIITAFAIAAWLHDNERP